MKRTIAIISSTTGVDARLARFKDEFEQIEASLRLHSPDWNLTPYRAHLGEYPEDLDALDGVIFPGSPNSVNEPHEWIATTLELIRKLHALKKPMIGICFGHQAIAKALGGTVGPNPNGWSLGAVPVQWQKTGSQNAKELTLYAIHNEQVHILPDDAEITATAQGCAIAGFRIGAHILTTQHHPEMPTEFVSGVLDLLESDPEGRPDEALLACARTSLSAQVNSVEVMGQFAKFLMARDTDR